MTGQERIEKRVEWLEKAIGRIETKANDAANKVLARHAAKLAAWNAELDVLRPHTTVDPLA